MSNMADRLYRFLQANRGLPFRSMAVFNYLLEAALAGGIMILLMLLVRRFLRPRLGSRAIWMAWLLVAVRLLTPLAIPNPLMNELRPTWSEDAAARPVADQIRVRFNDTLNDVAWQLNNRQYQAAVEEGMSRQEYNRSLDGDTFPEVLQKFGYANSYGWTGKWFLLGYGAVALGVAGWMIGANASFRRKLKKNRAGGLSADMQAVYAELCNTMGVKHPPAVYLADPLPGACLVGAIRPAIYVPAAMDAATVPHALRHELCHFKARDNWWSLLRLICCAVQWFNPLVWIAARCARIDCELACDDRVSALLDEEGRRAYAEALLTSAARRSAPGLAVAATGMTMNGKRLRQRMKAILENRTVRRWAANTFLGVACAVALMAFCTAESDPMSQRRPGFDNDLNDLPLATEWYEPDALTVTPEDDTLTARAEAVAASPLLNFRGYYDMCVSEDEYGVSLLASGSAYAYGDVTYLRLDPDGRILQYAAGNALEPWGVDDRTTPPNTDAAVQSFLQALADSLFGGAEVTDYDPANGGAVTRAGVAGYRFTAKIGGEKYSFIFNMGRMAFDVIEAENKPGPAELSPLDAINALWSKLKDVGVMEPSQCMIFVEAINDGSYDWRVTWYADELAGENTLSALAEKFGQQPRYTITLDVSRAGGVGELTLEPIVYTLVDDVPADAEQRVTAAYMETYNLIAGKKLMRDDTLPVGVPYTIVGRAEADLACLPAGEYPGYLLIRYESPRYGTTVDRWTQDIATWDRSDPASTPIPAGSPGTLTYEDMTVRAEDKADHPDQHSGFSAPPATALSVGEALAVAVKAVEERYGLPASDLLVYHVSYGYKSDAADFVSPYWQFDIYVNDYDFFEVIFHDPDGELLYIAGPSEGNG